MKTVSVLFFTLFLTNVSWAQSAHGALPRDLFALDSKLGVSIYLFDGDKDPEARNKLSFRYFKEYLEPRLKDIGFKKVVIMYHQEENYKVDGNVQLSLMNEGATHYMPIGISSYPNDKAFDKGKESIDKYRNVNVRLHAIQEETIDEYDYALNNYRSIDDVINKLRADIKSVPKGFFTTKFLNEDEIDVETEAHLTYPSDLKKEAVLYVKSADEKLKKRDDEMIGILTNDYPFKFKVVDPFEYEIEKGNYKYQFGLYGSAHTSYGSIYGGSRYYFFEEILTGDKYYGHEHGYPTLGSAMKGLIALIREQYHLK